MYIDIMLVLIVAVCIIAGILRGFVKSVYSIASTLGALILVMVLADSAVDMMSTTDFAHNIYDQVYAAVAPSQSGTPAGVDITSIALTDEALADAVKQGLVRNPDEVAVTVTTAFLKAMISVALFIAIKLLLFIVYLILNTTAKLPVLKGVNSLAGGLMGTANGIIVSFILFKLISVISFLYPFGFSQMLESSVIVKNLIGFI